MLLVGVTGLLATFAVVGFFATGALSTPVLGVRRQIRAAKRRELRHVAAAPEWPYDASTLSRFLIYLLIPLASWFAAALVERGIDALLQ